MQTTTTTDNTGNFIEDFVAKYGDQFRQLEELRKKAEGVSRPTFTPYSYPNYFYPRHSCPNCGYCPHCGRGGDWRPYEIWC